MSHSLANFNLQSVPSPSYVVDEAALESNLQILAHVQKASGAKILLALKAFSMFDCAHLIQKYLSGTCASGLYEAKLGKKYFGGEVHTYAAAYRAEELEQILSLSNHVVFNSPGQWQRFKQQCLEAKQQRPELSFGLRINPEHSEGTTPIYDPCAPYSRMGCTAAQLTGFDWSGLEGIHFHTLCEQDFAPLARTLNVIEQNFSEQLHKLKWVNFGGGHHITRANYQRDELISCITHFKRSYDVQVYLEPGEAIALNTGIIVAEVLDIIHNGMDIAILDASATCHMPDVLEMPYRPNITGSAKPSIKAYTYRLGGPSCLTGDVIGDYSFDRPLAVGDRLMFEDMAIYTMVKNTTFNGIPLPSIVKFNSQTGAKKVVKTFSYSDFENRLS